MKKSILFILVFALFAASLFLLLNASVKNTNWQLLVMVFLPLGTYIWLKTNFRTDD